MKVFAMEKSKVLAKEQGWSLKRAEGYVEGERYRRRGLNPSLYLRVGKDEYCLGFRASFYQRRTATTTQDEPGLPRLARQ